MHASAESGLNKQVSLRQLASKHSKLGLLLFAVLIVMIVVASMRDRQGMEALGNMYNDQFRVAQFKAGLSKVLLPLNAFAMTSDVSNMARIRKVISEYKASYLRTVAIPSLGAQDKSALAEVDALMNHVMSMVNDVADAKPGTSHAAQTILSSRHLVQAAQQKLQSIINRMETRLAASAAERQHTASMQLYILLGFIVCIVLLLEFLNRRLLKHAQTVSRVSSTLAESAGDIVRVNKMQASATDQQARFMEKVMQGLELIADSGKEISAVISSLEKNSVVMQSLAKGGAKALQTSLDAADKLNAGTSGVDGADDQISDQILKPLQQIQYIADEVHLLALNASIDGADQAASSISNEVQRMAGQIREYTEDIRSAVQQMSGTSNHAENQRQAYINNSVELARQTSDLLFRLEAMSEKNGQAASAIARANGRQHERNLKILQALQHISELLHISGNRAQAYNDASARLSEASESLQHMA